MRIVWFGHNVNDKYDFGVSTHTIELHENSLDLHEQMQEVISDLNHASEDLEPLAESILNARDSNWATTISTMFPVALMSMLYACSDEPDFLDVKPPRILQGRGPVKGDDLNVRQVGLRIGTALRSHRRASVSSTGVPQSTMTPHVRRAHWHRFWVGPRNGERRLTLKWLPPIPVNVDKGEVEATVRPLRSA
jgi:hypothetical protein